MKRKCAAVLASLMAAMTIASAPVSIAAEAETKNTEPEMHIVVLDPGHDAAHCGAHGNGLYEERLTLAIASRCKEALEASGKFQVYMTRTGESCPYPGSKSTEDNAMRVDFAKSVNAEVYVALHLNSEPAVTSKGAMVFYPSTFSSYNRQTAFDGRALAEQIQSHLVGIGLRDNGTRTRLSTENTYEDGSPRDYYGVINKSRSAQIPGVIVEHAYLSNSEDAAYLSNDENLTALATADAEGIAAYFDDDLTPVQRDAVVKVVEEEQIPEEPEPEVIEDAAKNASAVMNVDGKSLTYTGPADKDEIGTVTIPASIDGYPVTRIAAGSFEGSRAIRVNGGENIREIESSAFSGAKKLRILDLSDAHIARLGKQAFTDSNLTRVKIRTRSGRIKTYRLKH